MKFRVEHEFPAPPDAVIELMLDPEFARSLTLPDLGPAEVLDSDRGDDQKRDDKRSDRGHGSKR